MDQLGPFLRSRRARLRPKDVGLPAGVGRRQTPGLRREELAAVAGVSVDYYIRLEQGRDTNPGAAVLAALADALRLDQDEREHLYRLAQAGAGLRPAPRTPAPAARPGLVRLLSTVRPTPAYVLSPESDILAENPAGEALLHGLADWPRERRNIVRYMFRAPAARDLVVPWEAMARDCVAHLRTVAGGRADALVAELSTHSPDFARLWSDHEVRVKSGYRRTFAHPVAGRLDLTSEVLSVADGQRLVVFQPTEPDSLTH
ncbi:transcriptional regulator [Virgisporangium aliadipatigenens]|uniref:Transcriptional regulator n=1 Tax=Virgisporangium aliadipatigenens TaxID=741659 RepID=A0A8J3YMH7_9ACTN|nr:helix-turn-helix domain-containing protein [Virgisporangium aliadipatigenens]GIJ46818.1 transcriptional regulator [Virgisporangium aliadipatigenens]